MPVGKAVPSGVTDGVELYEGKIGKLIVLKRCSEVHIPISLLEDLDVRDLEVGVVEVGRTGVDD